MEELFSLYFGLGIAGSVVPTRTSTDSLYSTLSPTVAPNYSTSTSIGVGSVIIPSLALEYIGDSYFAKSVDIPGFTPKHANLAFYMAAARPP